MPFQRPLAAGSLGALAHCWRPVPAFGHTVSGDALFVEARRSDHRTLFLLVDVTHHGTEAHAIVCLLANQLLRDPCCANLSPADLLQVLHGLLQPVWLDTGKFVVALALLVTGSGIVEAAAAGAPPPMLLRSRGVWSPWQVATAPPLGAPTNLPHHASSLELARGDVLLAFTDGLTEARSTSQEQYQHGRFLDFLQGIPPDTTGAPLLDGLLADVCEHVGQSWPDDDTTVLCLWHPFPLRLPC
jgi:sigma-B regulation protein RsbU (phosphoserine phosphatase)